MSEGAILLADAAATAALGARLAPLLGVGDVVTLSGPLGSGKTSLARGVLAALGLAGEAPSPSFPIVIAYAPPEVRLPLWHVDLYRLESADEARELGLDEAAEEAALLVEWPERLGAAAWPQALALRLDVTDDGGRCLTWRAPEAWGRRWPPSP